MDFNFKKVFNDAGTALSRVVQLTEEKLGTSEKTELDAHFENLAERSDQTKLWTEKLLSDTEAVLTPNPGNRVEDYLFEKIEKKKPVRLTNIEYLGNDMIEAGNDFGPGTSYGSALIKVGQCEQRIGSIEKEFIASANHCFLTPLRKFLDGEMKTILKERGLLESKRLDLDACKSRVRKARSMLGQPPNAERDLRVAQSEYDRQAEITKLLLEGVNSSHASHLRCLHQFVDAQVTYYERCHHTMQQLKSEMQSLSGAMPGGVTASSSSSSSFLTNHLQQQQPTLNPVMTSRDDVTTAGGEGGQKARVLCDYDAKDQSELSLMTDEVITVFKIPESEDYLMGERGTQRGKVPAVFVEFLN